MDRQRFLIPMLALITVWRLALLPTVELSPDEALALFFSKHHDWWHLEMGPLTPWLVRISTAIFGHGELGVRVLAPGLALLTSVCFWRVCRGIFDAATAAWATVLLQVMPCFNIAAITMTSATVNFAVIASLILVMRMALHRAAPWSRAWFGAAGLMFLAVLADWRNIVAWLAIVTVLGMSERRRHHVFSRGFALVTAGAMLGLSMFIGWNASHGWPILEAGEAEPVWKIWPNVLRWVLLVSPLLLAGMVKALKRIKQQGDPLHHDAVVMAAIGIPYAILDFAWGPGERWPNTGFSIWVLPALALVVNGSLGSTDSTVRQKILQRTAAVLFAALQSMALMRTDIVRSIGIPWPFQRYTADKEAYSRFLRADPSAHMIGWRQGANVVSSVLTVSGRGEESPWFVIANTWQVATALDAYLASDAVLLQPTADFPRISALLRAERDQPLATLRRYDALAEQSHFRGKNALFVTDDTNHRALPAEIANHFERTEPVTVVRITHGGNEVRTLKIFACHGYKPPDL